ncbi:hypothetical protein GCM10022212_01340 [Actimicrobium antarcticum]|uniref:Uncharacterized protein n=1 Tax=Actimicrobium antarcticum TaxID=1051899 RepID=A0ABP7SHK1_9BURK
MQEPLQVCSALQVPGESKCACHIDVPQIRVVGETRDGRTVDHIFNGGQARVGRKGSDIANIARENVRVIQTAQARFVDAKSQKIAAHTLQAS